MARQKGTVKWFKNLKGYGFLGHDDEADVFLHYSSISSDGYKSLREGDLVEYDITAGPSGNPQVESVLRLRND